MLSSHCVPDPRRCLGSSEVLRLRRKRLPDPQRLYARVMFGHVVGHGGANTPDSRETER